MSDFYVGLDLGQARDFTALAVVERVEMKGEWDAMNWTHRKVVEQRLRHLERVPLGTPYPEVVARVVAVLRGLPGRAQLVVDATGVGRPVVDMLRAAGTGCWIRAVMVTGGQEESEAGGYSRVPKRDLIVGLQVLLQSGVLKIAERLQWGPALMKEMAEMRVKVTGSGSEQYGAWREGSHDDLVFAVALAGWGAEKWCARDCNGGGRLF